ncbi:Uncharacterised protein [Serratia rubidaea]|uniref:Uncharacterized protein n=1 Tax=Serratia rubidaea TaxID=61652 RepID=A0A4U9HNN0_SERRU|nr:Uncharacterised protein [Serratia rubidaea]
MVLQFESGIWLHAGNVRAVAHGDGQRRINGMQLNLMVAGAVCQRLKQFADGGRVGLLFESNIINIALAFSRVEADGLAAFIFVR